VRRLAKPKVQPGEFSIEWDGKDLRGQVVPDEAYCVRASLKSATSTSADSPCERTGGEYLRNLGPTLMAEGNIAFAIGQPSRVLIRVGIKSGPMLRSLSVWRPYPAGKHVRRWGGFDDSGLDLRSDRLSLLVTAFALPEHVVITSGEGRTDYRAWRLSMGWPERTDRYTTSGGTPQRSGQRVAREHYMPRYKDREPRIDVRLSALDGQPLIDGAPLPAQVRVVVDLHPDDRWLMQEQLYEIGFFLDGNFIAEEENGYVPIGWIWDTGKVAAGKHVLTVNLTGFGGRVGTRTIALVK
jgi:hypothetical protein